jgi:hypothetical protein
LPSIFVCEVEKCDLCIESSFNKPTGKEDWEMGKEDWEMGKED